MRNFPAFAATTLLPAIFVLGCQQQPSSVDHGLTVYDSAGVTIVESRSPFWDEKEAWRIEGEPFLSIGMADDEVPDPLTHVQDAIRLEDGRILLLTGGSDRSIRVFGPSGRHLEKWGRSGEGPGEFGLPPRSLHRDPSRGIVVPEAMARRVNRFDLHGTFQGRVTVRYDGEVPRPDRVQASACCELREVLSNGDWLVAFPDHPHLGGTGARRGEQALVRFTSSGERIGEFARLPGRLWRPADREDFGPLAYVPFTGYLATTVVGEEVFIGNGAAYRVDVFDPTGRPIRSLRLDREPPAFRMELRQAFVESARAVLERSMDERETSRRMTAVERRLPTRLAAYSDMLADPDGHLWLISPAVPGANDHRRTATVVDREGRFLGDVLLPPGLRPLQVGSDWILGAVEDGFGESEVVLHRLRKRGSPLRPAQPPPG